MSKDFNSADYLNEYNSLISQASLEFGDRFAALASPTLNKQETISFLYRDVVHFLNGFPKHKQKWIRIRDFFLFLPLLCYHLFKLTEICIRFKVKSLPKNCIYIRSWLVPKSICKNVVGDDYFRKLIEDLKEKTNVVVGLQPLNYGKLLTAFKRAKKPEEYIIPIGLLSWGDVIMVLYHYLLSARIQVKKKYLFKNKNINWLINYSLLNDFYKFRSLQAYLDLAIAKKVKEYKPILFLYNFENQAWEKAYLKEFKDSGTIRIGYQSSGFSLRFLNFFPTETDKAFGLFPDKILTVGELYTCILKKYGHFPIPIETFAALRFEYPTVNGKYIIARPSNIIYKRILYAFAVHVYQYFRIIKELIEVFGDSEVEVHLKFHPLYDAKNLHLKLPVNFKIWGPMQGKKLHEIYDVVLFNDNSFGLESLIEGVKSFEYNFGELYPEQRLIDFELYNTMLDKTSALKLKEEITDGTFVKIVDTICISEYINRNYHVYQSKMADNLLTQ